MAGAARALELVPLIYEAALDPGLWSGVMEGFGRVVGANRAALIRQDAVTGVGHALTFGYDQAVMADYFGYYGTRNVLLPHLAYAPAPSVHTDQDALPKDAFRRSEYFADFLSARLDVNSVLLGLLWRDKRDVVAINFCRGPGADEFDIEEKAALGALTPHLQRSFALALRLGSLDAAASDALELVQRCAHAMLVLEADARVVFANAAAEALLTAAEAVGVEPGGHLRAARPELTRALRALAARAAAGDDGGVLPLARPGGGRPLLALVMPFPASREWLGPARDRALVMLRDPERRRALPEGWLEDLFGLTPGEARVASALHRLGSLQAAAATLGISGHTARAHLNAALGKLGVHRQAELVRLLTHLEDLAPPEPGPPR